MVVTPQVSRQVTGPAAWRSRGGGPAEPARRLAWLDALRGGALLGMMAFHAAWDLHAFGLIETDPSRAAGWRLLGTGVAALFLALSGVGLGLAVRQGASLRRMAWRLGRIAAAAALVTAATRWAVPEAPIWFGILHCIVVTNGLALLLRPAPTPWLIAAAAAAAAAPFGLRGVLGSGWAWTGLAAGEPATLDFRPVLPWLAPVLLGLALGRTVAADPRPAPGRGRWGVLAWAGRHSLFVYLAHQPLIVGVLLVALGPVPRDDPATALLRQPDQAGAFLRRCRDACITRGSEKEVCTSTCHCVLTSALGRAAAPASHRWAFPAGGSTALDTAVASCRRGSDPPG